MTQLRDGGVQPILTLRASDDETVASERVLKLAIHVRLPSAGLKDQQLALIKLPATRKAAQNRRPDATTGRAKPRRSARNPTITSHQTPPEIPKAASAHLEALPPSALGWQG